VPFISRYRKEATGELDEVQIQNIQERMGQLVALDDRRAAIVKSLEERKLMTDVLRAKIEKADTMNALEDIFAPFRPKRRTKATIAKEKGLEPLADFIEQNVLTNGVDLDGEAAKFVNSDAETDELKVKDAAEALAGARDIIAERISDHRRGACGLAKALRRQRHGDFEGHVWQRRRTRRRRSSAITSTGPSR
jgi:uncharacterized protein